MLYNINSIEPTTVKAKGLVNLFNKGLRIPLTILFSSSKDIKEATNILNIYKNDNNIYYIRFNFSDNDYPHDITCFANNQNIQEQLSSLFKAIAVLKKDKFDVIIQPMLQTDWSGGIMVKGNNLLVEIVQGNPRILFRNGFFYKRILFNSKLKEIDYKIGCQPFSYNFNNKKLKLEKNPFFEFTYDFQDLENFYSKLENDCLYEFSFSNNQIFFLQEKSHFKGTYMQLTKNDISPPFFIFNNLVNIVNTCTYDYPCFEYIKLCNNLDRIVVTQGAYLSHFATSLGEKRIHCEFLS
mgnify:CR=1 FL=1